VENAAGPRILNGILAVLGCSGKFFGFPHPAVDILVFLWITGLFWIWYCGLFWTSWGL